MFWDGRLSTENTTLFLRNKNGNWEEISTIDSDSYEKIKSNVFYAISYKDCFHFNATTFYLKILFVPKIWLVCLEGMRCKLFGKGSNWFNINYSR